VDNSKTYAAPDTYKKQRVGAAVRPDTSELEVLAVNNTVKDITKRAKKIKRNTPGQVRLCYEADVCGFTLKRRIEGRTFHDLRRTALSNWPASGMSEHDVVVLSGHSSFSATHESYLAVRKDLVDRARRAAGNFWRAPGARPESQSQGVDNRPEKVLNNKNLGFERP